MRRDFLVIIDGGQVTNSFVELPPTRGELAVEECTVQRSIGMHVKLPTFRNVVISVRQQAISVACKLFSNRMVTTHTVDKSGEAEGEKPATGECSCVSVVVRNDDDAAAAMEMMETDLRRMPATKKIPSPRCHQLINHPEVVFIHASQLRPKVVHKQKIVVRPEWSKKC